MVREDHKDIGCVVDEGEGKLIRECGENHDSYRDIMNRRNGIKRRCFAREDKKMVMLKRKGRTIH